jgi:hypothetical protein
MLVFHIYDVAIIFKRREDNMIDSKYAMQFLKPAGSTAPSAEKPERLCREELSEKLKSLKKKNTDDGNPVIERDIDKELPHGKVKCHDDGPEGR